MPKLEISHRIYARPSLYYMNVERYIEEAKQSNNSLTEIVYGDQFNWITGFYLSSDSYVDNSIVTWVNPFSSYTNVDILSSFPPFSGYPLDYEVLTNEISRIKFDNLSSFDNITLIAVNPAGYAVRSLHID
jgi:hypothetical protein